ncbi:hypothetical protein BDZ89DRAFT_1100729 [Hymenopellis radicata]|nr:hypothetical protein BDZ89DRAFT_1100729 [Hymenopellis radicata]
MDLAASPATMPVPPTSLSIYMQSALSGRRSRARLAEAFDFCHFSAGDLLRAEQTREGSEYGEMIRTRGTIVPVEVTVKLLENAMLNVMKSWFLVDGFPRKMDQAVKFEEEVCTPAVVLFFTTTEDRGKTGGREDDNAESIKKRFKYARHRTFPKSEKVAEIDSNLVSPLTRSTRILSRPSRRFWRDTSFSRRC